MALVDEEEMVRGPKSEEVIGAIDVVGHPGLSLRRGVQDFPSKRLAFDEIDSDKGLSIKERCLFVLCHIDWQASICQNNGRPKKAVLVNDRPVSANSFANRHKGLICFQAID